MFTSLFKFIFWFFIAALSLALYVYCFMELTGADAPTGSVEYSVSSAPGTLFVEVQVHGDEQVTSLELTYDRVVKDSSYLDLCVPVQPRDGGTASTWAALPMGDKCILQYGGTEPLTKGTYVMTLQFSKHRGTYAGTPMVDTTPALLSCKVR